MREDLKEIGTSVAVFVVVCLLAVALCQADEPAPFEPSETQSYLASLNDTYRVSRGLAPHKLDADLCRIAQAHAERMAASGRMFHGGQDQCVAWGYATVPSAMSAWRSSPGHCAWLLSGTERSGWGAAVAANGARYWCAVFRSPEAKHDADSNSSNRVFRLWRRR